MSNAFDWEDPAFLQATIDYQAGLLVLDLPEIYKDPSRANRNYEAEQVVHERLNRQIPKGWSVLFTADLPDNGACRFQLRVVRRPEDMHQAEPVFAEHDLNFMKPHAEWIRPPSVN